MDRSAATEAALTVVASTREGGGEVRVLGGIAVALRCPSTRRDRRLARDYSDIDLVTTRKASPILARTLEGLGYVPADRFNAAHGRSRMMFDHANGLHADVFVEQFEMCHRLDLSERLSLHPVTVSLADLLLTKLQIAEMNAKDVTDLAALFLDHGLGTEADELDVPVISELLRTDWGWWRTVTHNLRALPGHFAKLGLPSQETEEINNRVSELLGHIDRAPKSLRWRARAKAGDRIAWREEPEESR